MAPRLNLPPLTRGSLVLLLVLSILRHAICYQPHWLALGRPIGHVYVVPYLEIVPQRSFVYPWVFASATLLEANVFTLLISGATLFYGGKYLERAWTSPEFAKFMAVASLAPNILTCLVVVSLYFLGRRGSGMSSPIYGGVALQAAFLVAFKQLVPEHTVTIARGLIKMRVKHFPALFVLFQIISGVIFGTSTAALLAVFGFLSSWTYLRFYKHSFADLSTSQSTSLRGDASETFAFAYFFPDPLHGPVATVADAVYNALVSVKVCTPFSAADVDAGNSQANARGEGGLSGLLGRTGGGGPPAPGSARAEAERRRAVALKALDQRLHAATSQAQSAGQAAVAVGPSTGTGEAGAATVDVHEEPQEQREDGGVDGR
ncbi:MAG: hypothetical protein M1832_000429 [Thelocarpon impressellum]|nr:MAG: hypothetical protein M1832_000429 [Thelocarpon impressellum]